MRTALFFKVLAGYVLVVIAVPVIFSIVFYRVAHDHQRQMLTERLEGVARAVAVAMAPQLAAGVDESLRLETRHLAETTDTRLMFLDREGNVLADSHAPVPAVSGMRAYPEIRGALLGRTTAAVRKSPTLDVDMLYVAVPVQHDNEFVGVARTSISLSRLNALVRDLRLRLWYAVGLVAAVALLIALIASLWFSRSIEQVGHLLDEIRKGNFSVRLFLRRSDTLARVAEKVNAMAERLDQLFGDLTMEKDKLDSIVASLQDGLLLLDHDGVIQFANESFSRVFDCMDLVGKHYWETVREPAFTDLVGVVVHHGQSCRREVTIRDRTYLCAAAPMRTRQQVVILFHDITEVRQLGQMKRDFVANVSHELRTPLTAIKGFTDMVTETATAEQQRHLQVIHRHTDRLICIVEDLLALSSLEHPRFKLNCEPVDLVSLIRSVIELYRRRATLKGLGLALQGPESLPLVQVDSFKLEQVFVNLIDNAIKYTERGRIVVRLTQPSSREVSVEVTDTGIGIPTRHLSRIFERFYVVDRSRSRQAGGTGLGLAIVKHVISLHGGEVTITSRSGHGTTVRVVLPVPNAVPA